MAEAFYPIFVLLVGAGLALFYVGGLWLTIGRLPTTRYPTILFLTSFWGRLLLCAAGIYLVSSDRPGRFAVCMVGFWVMRTVLVRRWGKVGLRNTVVSQ